MEQESIKKIFFGFLRTKLSTRTFRLSEWKIYLEGILGRDLMGIDRIDGLEILSEFLSHRFITIGSDWANISLEFWRITDDCVDILEGKYNE